MSRPYMGDPGMYTGIKDRHGNPVHVGDVLSFDPREWGGECEYVLRFENGELVTKGTVSDITNWCVVIWSWDTEEARAWREEKADRVTRPGWPHSCATGPANMQQIPHGTEEVAKIRQAFLDQHPRLVETDFSAMEARIMAQEKAKQEG